MARLVLTISSGLARFLAEGAGRACQFGMIYAAQRSLGAVAYGQFAVLLGVAFLASVAADFGIQLTTTRQLAVSPPAANEIAGRALSVRAALALGTAVLVCGAGWLRSPAEVAALSAVVSGLLLIGLAETCGYVLRGIGRVGHETLLLLGLRMSTAAAGLIAVLISPTPLALGLAYAVSGAFGAIIAIRLARSALPGLRANRPSLLSLRAMMADAAPLGVAVFISIAYTRAPLFVLDATLGPADAAAYSVAQRLTEPLAIFPASFMAPLFPRFASAVSSARPQDAVALAGRQALRFGAMGVGIAAVFALGAPWLIGFLYPGGQYASSAAPLRWLALALAPAFANYALTHLLVAQKRTRLNAVFVSIQLVAVIVISLALAPAMGPAGPAVAILVCEGLLLSLCILAR